MSYRDRVWYRAGKTEEEYRLSRAISLQRGLYYDRSRLFTPWEDAKQSRYNNVDINRFVVFKYNQIVKKGKNEANS